MQVTLKVGETDYVLAHGPGRGVDLHVGPLNEFRNSLRTSIQVDPIIDADNPKIFDRGNLTGQWPFSVEVEKATAEEAMEYALTYPDILPRKGDIWIEMSSTTVKLISAGIENVSCALYGVRIYITYSVVYGTMEYGS